MTIIVGVVCDDGIVIASDSQSTEDIGYKRTSEKKLHGFDLNGASVIIGGSGEMRFTNRVVEIFEELARSHTFQTPRQVACIAEQAVRCVVGQYFVDGPTCPSRESKEFDIMLGVRCGNSWELFVVDNEAVAARELKYAAAGSGGFVGEYLLGWLYNDDYHIDAATRVAVYAIEEVKNFDLYCGGSIQAFALGSGPVKQVSEKTIEENIVYVKDMDQVQKLIWKIAVRGQDAMELLKGFQLDKLPPPEKKNDEERSQ